MISDAQSNDILHRLKHLEDRLREVEKELSEQSKQDTKISMEIVSLKNEFDILKIDVISTVKEHTQNTWNLINKSIKIIGFLIIVILLLVGIKVGPDILNLL